MMFILSRRLRGDGGETPGFVLGVIDLRDFERLYATIVSTEAEAISIVTADRTVLVRDPAPPAVSPSRC